MKCFIKYVMYNGIYLMQLKCFFSLLGIITGKNEKKFLETMEQFTSQVPPGANESNFITVSVLINTEQIRHQSSKASFIYEMVPEWHYPGNESQSGRTPVGYRCPGRGTGTLHTSQTWHQCPVPLSLLRDTEVRWAHLSSLLLIILAHHGVAGTNTDKQNLQSFT